MLRVSWTFRLESNRTSLRQSAQAAESAKNLVPMRLGVTAGGSSEHQIYYDHLLNSSSYEFVGAGEYRDPKIETGCLVSGLCGVVLGDDWCVGSREFYRLSVGRPRDPILAARR